MKLKYYSETDTLYIELSNNISAESSEIQTGIVADFDSNNNIVGIEIENASKILDFSNFSIEIPFTQIMQLQNKFERVKQVA